jgi:hypothetical protein
MTHRETDSGFCARASGSVGCEILDPDGDVIAWTVDGWWAAIIVGLLNGAEWHDPYSCGAAAPMNDKTHSPENRYR